MFFTAIKRVIKYGFLNFWRNAFVSTTSILVMVITLSFISSIIFIGAILSASLDSVRDQVDLSVAFVQDASELDIFAIKEDLESRADVLSVSYISREDVMAGFIERHAGNRVILQTVEELRENPLGARLIVHAFDPESYKAIAEYLEPDPLLGTENSIIYRVDFRDNALAIERLTMVINAVERFGLALTIALAFVSVLITFNTIRLIIYTSRNEIAIMRLVGASTNQVRGPFVISGVFYGLIAALITLSILYPLTFWLGEMTEQFFIGLNVFNYYLENFLQIFLLTVFSGIFIGGISSYLAVRRYLRV